MRTLLIGYHVASCEETRSGVVQNFLRAASALHRDMNLPCTVFVQGKTLETCPDPILRFRDECGDLVDFQQYTYAGLPLKTVCQENHRGIRIFRGLLPEHGRDSIERTNELMQRTLGVRPRGLSAPLGHYRGLADAPEVLEVLHECGIRFVRSWTRNAHDWSPLAFETQPFTYDKQGFPEMMEIPGQGWPDDLLREMLGSDKHDAFVRHCCKDLDYVAAKELVWSFVANDWSAIREDPEMRAQRAILEHAQESGFAIVTHRDHYEAIAGPITDAPPRTPTESVPSTPRGATIVKEADRQRGRKRSWRSRRTWLRALVVRNRGHAPLRRLMRKAGSERRRKLLVTLSR